MRSISKYITIVFLFSLLTINFSCEKDIPVEKRIEVFYNNNSYKGELISVIKLPGSGSDFVFPITVHSYYGLKEGKTDALVYRELPTGVWDPIVPSPIEVKGIPGLKVVAEQKGSYFAQTLLGHLPTAVKWKNNTFKLILRQEIDGEIGAEKTIYFRVL
ncbi:MAG: hypothetical protein N4A45_06420 [Flavobacteriales bacterium]|jgi:hypothetical protein|nr:hypothetical protein [Flavobacteriales bacterium]